MKIVMNTLRKRYEVYIHGALNPKDFVKGSAVSLI